MSKYSIVIDALKKLMVADSDVVLNFKSEKESAKQFNYIKDILSLIRHWNLYSGSDYVPEWVDAYFDSEEERRSFLNSAVNAGMVGKKMSTFTEKGTPIKHYVQIYGKPCLIFTSEHLTQTYKQISKENLYEKQKQLAEFIGTMGSIPSGLGVQEYDTITEVEKKMRIIDKYLSGELSVPECSEKQAEWISRKLGWSYEKSKTLNKIQASELLDGIFNEKNDVIEFYQQQITESNNCRRSAQKINESQLRTIVKESVKTVLKNLL